MYKFVAKQGSNFERITQAKIVGYNESTQRPGYGVSQNPIFASVHEQRISAACAMHLPRDSDGYPVPARDLSLAEVDEYLAGLRAQRERMRDERSQAMRDAKAEHEAEKPKRIAAAEAFAAAVETAKPVLGDYHYAEAKRGAEHALQVAKMSIYRPADDMTLPEAPWVSLDVAINVLEEVRGFKAAAEADDERTFRERLARIGMELPAQ